MSVSALYRYEDFPPVITDVIIIGGGATGAGIARDCITWY